MTHQVMLEIPDNIYQSLVRKAQATGRTVEAVANEWLAAAAARIPAESGSRSWIGAFESEVPDAAERHHDYLGQALYEELRGDSGA